ncbi:hypothetical protein JTB14_012281 [Gonioctena quinquepunctata]|nr:hypothetical protein JTB14_012281 [Gonioctena quinquepunctata]
MDKQEEKKLLRWYDDELSDDDDNIESEHDPFSGDSDYAPDEPPPSETSSEEDNEVIFPATETGTETQDSLNEENADNNLQKNQSSNGNDDDGWVDKSSDIPNFDSGQMGIKVDGIQNLSPIEVFPYHPNFSDIKLILPALCRREIVLKKNSIEKVVNGIQEFNWFKGDQLPAFVNDGVVIQPDDQEEDDLEDMSLKVSKVIPMKRVTKLMIAVTTTIAMMTIKKKIVKY